MTNQPQSEMTDEMKRSEAQIIKHVAANPRVTVYQTACALGLNYGRTQNLMKALSENGTLVREKVGHGYLYSAAPAEPEAEPETENAADPAP